MKILIIILAVTIIIVLAAIHISLINEIKNFTSQLKNINEKDTNAEVNILSSDKNSRKLCLEINKTLQQKQKFQTKYKKMDLELRQAIANISHDLRTPLTSIKGYIQLIDYPSLSQNEKKQYLDIVKKRTQSLENLISGFYDLSRLESSVYKFELKSLNLPNILTDSIASFYNDFLNNKIEPNIDIDEKVPQIIADEDAVKRIFSNLINNALKYGSEYIAVSLKQRDDYIITVFENRAPNLKEEDVSHLFERFFTADRARNGKSTGLGLAITKELLEKMGNSIHAELSEGKLSLIIKWKIAL